MFEQVLVAVDGSEPSTRAARTAAALAETFEAALTVVVAAGGELSEADAERIAADAADAGAASRRPVETRVVADDPRRAVVDAADDLDADVVVMGRHGHAGLGERLLGSVTEKVLRGCERPVLTVSAGDGSVGDYGNVLMTSDGSDVARAAVPYGTSVASASDAALHLLTVVDLAREGGVFSAGGVDQEFVDGLVADAEDDLDEFAAACESPAPDAALDVEQAVRTGAPSEEIAAYVDEEDVDLVAMASVSEESFAGQLLGSTTDRVLRTVDVPVLVVPAGE